MKSIKPYLKLCHVFRSAYCRLLCPQTCLLCGATGGTAPICPHCIETELIPYIDGYRNTGEDTNVQRCLHCGKILISEQNWCTRCRPSDKSTETRKQYCDRVFALFPYIGLGQKLLPAWKNNNIRSFSTVFAPLIFRFLIQMPEIAALPIVPVPPRPKKLREKGWDQIEDMVRDLAVFPQLTVYRCLKREDGTPQKKLSKAQRAVNLQGKIRASVKTVPEKLILLDDVMTTGATLESCAQCLKTEGCKEVYGICLFFD